MAKIFLLSCIALASMATINASPLPQDDGTHQILDIETPQIFNYNSPLKQPDSLRSRPYFDFLSTLYRHDAAKNDLFRPYQRQIRDVSANVRPRRAILFRPLFVYKQQQVRKQEAAERRRRRY